MIDSGDVLSVDSDVGMDVNFVVLAVMLWECCK